MADRSTDTQTFSSFVALNRADRTHDPVRRGPHSLLGFAIAGIMIAVAIGLLIR
jgi:hypothetical protein